MQRSIRILAIAVATAFLGAGAAIAEQPAASAKPPASATMPVVSSPADQTMMQGMKKMQADMAAAPVTGNTDKDFVAMMLPHHQGAVDMAKVELQYGRNPAMRKLARDIVAAQDREIALMRAWQSKQATN